jgi:hypothetical protein
MMNETASESSFPFGVTIKGAQGAFAEKINGVYSTSGPSSFRKIGCDEQLLEYQAGPREWQVVSSS